MTKQPLLHTVGLTAGYRNGNRKHPVISDARLTLCAGEVTCLLGANGAGKSTLLRTIAGLQPPIAGDVFVGGRSLVGIPRRELAKTISAVYTERTLAGALTVRETVALGRQPYTGFFGRLSAADNEIVDHAMTATGISGMADRYLATLSDGERQKAMIARAVAQETPIMLLDEPTSFLDVASRLETTDLLRRLAFENNKAILVSTHDIADAMAIASRLWLVMPDHRVIEGSPDRLIADGAMDRLFEGRPIRFDTEALDFRLNSE